jgi:hypothetical protein
VDKSPPPEDIDAEGERYKKSFRAFQRRFATGIGIFGLGAAVFLFAVQHTVIHGISPWGFRSLLAGFAAVGLWYVRKKRFALAAVCLLWMIVSAIYLPQLGR